MSQKEYLRRWLFLKYTELKLYKKLLLRANGEEFVNLCLLVKEKGQEYAQLFEKYNKLVQEEQEAVRNYD